MNPKRSQVLMEVDDVEEEIRNHKVILLLEVLSSFFSFFFLSFWWKEKRRLSKCDGKKERGGTFRGLVKSVKD
jgi:hypothetical protein